ncbi:MAG: HlyD family efflux transporter periplasmic adaptor subunit [Acidobacteriota bacterium]|nr:HlyD family efflux transporter periplasmic adaptor subunit [Acidobacteriota bacterium]MDH3785560.1 HlyD family efflux transporter periplasmic adaptor subunit [Acidobacteriota bacterium]
MRRLLILAVVVAMTSLPTLASDLLVLSGSLRAVEAERFSIPVTSNWQVTIKWLIPEGEFVEEGDSIARLDPAGVEENLRQIEDQLIGKFHERANAKADARLTRMDLELALKRAEVEYKKARIDADIPQDVLKGIDYRKRQLDMATRQRGLEDAQMTLLTHDATTRSRKATVDIEVSELEQRRSRLADELDALDLRATRAGLVVHEVHPWFGRKIVEGDRLQATFPVARIPNLDTLEVEAWAGESEVLRIQEGQPVALTLDAYPQHPLSGTVSYVASAGEQRVSWGRASYFRVRIAMDDASADYMRPGMSVRCEIGETRTIDVAGNRPEVTP